MRRASLVLLALTGLAVMGCDAVRDAFSPRADVVARANDQTLTVERVAGWAGGSKQVPIEPMALNRLSHVWVDYALFAQALAAGKDLRDSATAMAAMWPVVAQLKWERFHDKLVARGNLTPQQVDSAYQDGRMRIFQHILFQVPPNSAPNVDAQKRRQAEQLLPQARSAGPHFAQLATRYSDAPGSVRFALHSHPASRIGRRCTAIRSISTVSPSSGTSRRSVARRHMYVSPCRTWRPRDPATGCWSIIAAARCGYATWCAGSPRWIRRSCRRYHGRATSRSISSSGRLRSASCCSSRRTPRASR